MKQIPQKPRIIIAQVAGSGTSGATVSMEKVLPALSVKKARGAWKKEEDVNIWRFALCSLTVRALLKSKVSSSPSDERLALVVSTPFAPDPPHSEIPRSLTDV
jgi:hypothetical protein